VRAEVGEVRMEVRPPDRAGSAPAGKLVLAVPLSYMNECGGPVAALVRRYRVAPIERLVVVHDELDLPTGAVRVKEGGGLAGHNGLRSIVAHSHADGFVRVRIGIGKPPGRQQGADYVLTRPSRRDRELLDVASATAADAVEMIAEQGVTAALNRFNARA
jgi:PTH1 family peptidyl-tRNA hydrolase